MNQIFQFAWLLSLITPFLLLDWKWALIVLLINFIGILPLGLVIIGLLKPIFGPGHWTLDFYTGISEGLFYLLLNSLINHPDNFLSALVIVYLINQVGRIFRASIQLDEVVTLVGFLSILILNYLFR